MYKIHKGAKKKLKGKNSAQEFFVFVTKTLVDLAYADVSDPKLKHKY